MTNLKLQHLPNPHLPIEVNSLEITPDGRLIRRSKPIEKFNCSFMYDDLPFDVTIHHVGNVPNLLLSLNLGFIPYTAESTDHRKTYQKLSQLGSSLPLGQIVTKNKQCLFYEIDYPIDPPLTATQIITYITAAILEARPMLALIKQQLS